jgi:hypothetical protein
MDMSDFFGDSSTAVAVAAALPLHSSLYPATAEDPGSMSGADFSDLGDDGMLGGRRQGLQPTSDASRDSQGPILQRSVSAENFPAKFSSSSFGYISTQIQ